MIQNSFFSGGNLNASNLNYGDSFIKAKEDSNNITLSQNKDESDISFKFDILDLSHIYKGEGLDLDEGNIDIDINLIENKYISTLDIPVGSLINILLPGSNYKYEYPVTVKTGFKNDYENIELDNMDFDIDFTKNQSAWNSFLHGDNSVSVAKYFEFSKLNGSFSGLSEIKTKNSNKKFHANFIADGVFGNNIMDLNNLHVNVDITRSLGKATINIGTDKAWFNGTLLKVMSVINFEASIEHNGIKKNDIDMSLSALLPVPPLASMFFGGELHGRSKITKDNAHYALSGYGETYAYLIGIPIFNAFGHLFTFSYRCGV